MNNSTSSRRVLSLRKGFFNDGHSYMLTSTSLGGSGLSPGEIAEQLQSSDPQVIRKILREGICLPLYFDGDCALDSAAIVVGDLTPQEDAEWIGRIRSRLNIPCGEFVFMGGGIEEDFDAAINNPEADPSYITFCKFPVDPGNYLIEVYAFVTSMTVNVAWDGMGINSAKETKESIAAWWDSTRPGQPRADWVDAYVNTENAASDDLKTLDYLIRLAPLKAEIPIPPLEEYSKWCGVFELRKPNPCPLGIPRDSLA